MGGDPGQNSQTIVIFGLAWESSQPCQLASESSDWYSSLLSCSALSVKVWQSLIIRVKTHERLCWSEKRNHVCPQTKFVSMILIAFSLVCLPHFSAQLVLRQRNREPLVNSGFIQSMFHSPWCKIINHGARDSADFCQLVRMLHGMKMVILQINFWTFR